LDEICIINAIKKERKIRDFERLKEFSGIAFVKS